MLRLELVCAAIVALYVGVRARRDPAPARFLLRLALLATAGWLGEDSVIHAYGFYSYSPRWHLFVDRVPLAIVLIWPVVIHSAWDLARRLCGPDARWVVLVGAALVLADASLIEPIAVHAGLWSWTAPGLFAVPPIGILGWAFFAGACIAVLRKEGGGWVLLLAPAATHLLLLVTWWGALRWLSGTLNPWPVVALAWGLALGLARWAFSTGARRRIPLSEMLVRAPAAAFFFVLLALDGRGDRALWAYALAFAPPYLALIDVLPKKAREALSEAPSTIKAIKEPRAQV